jgi:hypothetical protein
MHAEDTQERTDCPTSMAGSACARSHSWHFIYRIRAIAGMGGSCGLGELAKKHGTRTRTGAGTATASALCQPSSKFEIDYRRL